MEYCQIPRPSTWFSVWKMCSFLNVCEWKKSHIFRFDYIFGLKSWYLSWNLLCRQSIINFIFITATDWFSTNWWAHFFGQIKRIFKFTTLNLNTWCSFFCSRHAIRCRPPIEVFFLHHFLFVLILWIIYEEN